ATGQETQPYPAQVGPGGACRCAETQLAPDGSRPSSRSAALTAVTHSGDSAFMMALVSPAAAAMGRNAAPRTCRLGSPNETFDAPRHMLSPNSARMRRIGSSVVVTASTSAPTVIGGGSLTMAC